MARSHPQKGPWPQKCGVCDEAISYHEPRALCAECRKWRHRACLMGSVCCMCITRRPKEIFAAADEVMLGRGKRLSRNAHHPDRDAAAMLLWSMFSGRRDGEDASRSLGLDPLFTAEVASRFRDSGIWTEDATVIDFPECLEIPEEVVWLTCVVMSALIGSGALRREKLKNPGVGGAYAYYAADA